LREWLAAKGLPPLHFLVEPDTLSHLFDRRVFAAELGGEVIGFVLLSPVPTRNGWLFEQFVHRPGSPNGTVELMIDTEMYDQYGREQANAILGTIMTKIFLPGLDDVTAEYASKQLGETTIFSKTFQDFPGKKQDNTRYAEQKRALMLPNEIRQTAAHSEVLIISDTAPPIRAAYPPFAVHKNTYSAAIKGTPREIHLGDIDPQFSFTDSGQANQAAEHDKAAVF
jgi:hypothetical protein